MTRRIGAENTMDAETQGALKQLANEAASLLAAARESLRPPKQSSQLWPRAKDAAVILIPFVLGVAGYFVNLTLQTRETKARLVGLAIDILKAEPTGAEDNQRVRAWAVDVLARNSDVPIPAATRQDLQTTAVVPMGGIVGSDDRTVVTDTTSLPWAAVCQLSILASDGTQWIASGVLINPTTVITVD
jgi:V8-like Glu-specific endopeptidase